MKRKVAYVCVGLLQAGSLTLLGYAAGSLFNHPWWGVTCAISFDVYRGFSQALAEW